MALPWRLREILNLLLLIFEKKIAMKHLNPPALLGNARFFIGFMPEATKINQKIMTAYKMLREQDLIRRSHFFGGRYENIYLEREHIAEIATVLECAEQYAKELVKLPEKKLRSGFWINDMGPNESTTEHDHDDFDELLSGVYYVEVPPDSGELVIVDQYSRTQLKPQAGMFVFFAPDVLHSVNTNTSQERRISIGMNFGPMGV